MGFMTPIKANRAYRLQQKGQKEEALKLYEEVFAEGLRDPRYILSYALILIRDGQYQKAKEFLVRNQKAPGMTGSQRTTLLVDYAACCFRLGDIDKGINTLEQQFRKGETGLLYQTLGYLYVEKYDAANRPAEQEAPAEPVTEEAGEPAEAAAEETAEEKALSPLEAWEAGFAKAEEFIAKSVEYDEEDPICLDNMAQFIYRAKGDKAGAKEWFDRAYAIKDSQIDTLWFLSRYDVEAGNKEAALEKLEKALGGRFSPLNYCNREAVEKEIERLKGAN